MSHCEHHQNVPSACEFFSIESLNDGTVVVIGLILVFSSLLVVWQLALRRQPRPKRRYSVAPEVPRSGPWCPVLGHVPTLGVSPHRALAEFDRRLGSPGLVSIQLGTRRAVVFNGSASVRAAASRYRGSHVGWSSPLDDRPDWSAYRQYAGGRSVSFSADGCRLRAQRRVAAAAVGRLVAADGIAEMIVRREAQSMVADWLKMQQRDAGFDPANSVSTTVGSALYSMCYGIDDKLVDDKEYSEMLLGENPGTELFAIGKQVKTVNDGVVTCCRVWLITASVFPKHP